jgi:hypothetical protein
MISQMKRVPRPRSKLTHSIRTGKTQKTRILNVLRLGSNGVVAQVAHLALCPVLAQPLDLVGSPAKQEEVLLADLLPDLHVGSVQRPNDEATVQRKLHVARATSLHARSTAVREAEPHK